MQSKYELIVIGASAGGLDAIMTLLSELPKSFSTPIVVVQHQDQQTKSCLSEILGRQLGMRVFDIEDKMPISDSTVYLSPPGYHLQIEDDKSFSLSVDDPVHFARPSIDVLFETAANVYKSSLVGVLLTGANDDGAEGLCCIQQQGGVVLVQYPDTATSPVMPAAGIRLTKTSNIYSLENISAQLLRLTQGEKND